MKGAVDDMKIRPPADARKLRTYVFSFNEAYVGYFSVTLASLAAHADPGCLCDVVVLHSGLSFRSMQLLQSGLPDHVLLRFFDVSEYASLAFGDLSSKVSSNQWDVTTFYDLLVPLIMPDYERALYCDSDLVFLSDPGVLFDLSFDGSQLIAVRDSLSLACRILPENPYIKRQLDFVKNDLGIENLDEYFNAGILLFNIPAIVQEKYLERIRLAFEFPFLPTVDQDILNYVFHGNVKLAQQRFNYQVSVIGNMLDSDFCHAETEAAFREARSSVVLHYTTPRKPWKYPSCPLAECFWTYARQSPCYETILYGFLNPHPGKPAGARRPTADFSVRKYLKYRILSKIIPGRWKARYLAAYKKQKKLYRMIRSGK